MPSGIKISELESAGGLAKTEVLPLVQSSETKKATVQQVVDATIAEIESAGLDMAGSFDLTGATNERVIIKTGGVLTSSTVTVTELGWLQGVTTGIQGQLDAKLTSITGESLDDLGDVTITAIASGEFLKWNGTAWINNTLAEAGISPVGHQHAASDITGGEFADARISQSSVTQHQAALSITESQISDFGTYLENISGENLEELFDVAITAIATGEFLRWNGSLWVNNTFAEAGLSETGHSHIASDITGGEFADARISESSITQHQAALSVTESQISDLQSYLLNINGESIDDLSDVIINAPASGQILYYNGTNWINYAPSFPTGDIPEYISDLLDVDTLSPQGYDYLRWDAGSGAWINSVLLLESLAEPSLSAVGEIALDTTVTGFNYDIIKYYGGETLGVVALPSAQLNSPTSGEVVTYNSTTQAFELSPPAPQPIELYIDGNGSVISTGSLKTFKRINQDCKITGYVIVATNSGSISIDLRVDTYANHVPTSADSIVGSNPPSLTNQIKYKDTTSLSGWRANLTGDCLMAAHVNSCSGISGVSLILLTI